MERQKPDNGLEITFEGNLGDLMNICKSFIDHFTDVDSSEELKKSVSECKRIFDYLKKKEYGDLKNQENRNKLKEKLQKFFVIAGEIFRNITSSNDKKEGDVEMLISLNNRFLGLNRDINVAKFVIPAAEQSLMNMFNQSGNTSSYDYISEPVNNKYDEIKELNKKLGIYVHSPLLNFVYNELNDLVGVEDEIPSEDDFDEKAKNLFISKYLKIDSYEDFCKKYNKLKDKLGELNNLKKKIEICFDDKGNLSEDKNLDGIHMENLISLLDTRSDGEILRSERENLKKQVSKNVSKGLESVKTMKESIKNRLKQIFGV